MHTLQDYLEQVPSLPASTPRVVVASPFRPVPTTESLRVLEHDPAQLPRNRGSILSVRSAHFRVLQSPRPVAYLQSLRCVDERAATATDHALLECLLAAAYEVDPLLVRRGHAVPLRALTTVLGLGGTVRKREVLESLNRLTDRVFDLPALRFPKMRARRLRSDLPRARADVYRRLENLEEHMRYEVGPDAAADWRGEMDLVADRWESNVGRTYMETHGTADVGAIDFAKKQARQRFVLAVLEAAEPAFGIAYRPSAPGPVVPAPKRKAWPQVPGDPRLDGVAPVHEPFQLQPEDETWRFRPVTRYVLDAAAGEVVFELSPVLRGYLDHCRVLTNGKARFAYVDLPSMARFASRYTAVVYRQLVATSIEDVVVLAPTRSRLFAGAKNEGFQRATRMVPQTLTRIRYGDWDVSTDLEAFAKAVSYKLHGGGKAAQLRRTVVDAVGRDLARLDAADVTATIGVDADGVRLRARAYQPTFRVKAAETLDFDLAYWTALQMEDGGRPSENIELARQGVMQRIERLVPRDAPDRFRVRKETWLRVQRRNGVTHASLMRHYAEAWYAACAAAVAGSTSPEDGSLGGPRLLDLVDTYGPDRVAMRFGDEHRARERADEAVEARRADGDVMSTLASLDGRLAAREARREKQRVRANEMKRQRRAEAKLADVNAVPEGWAERIRTPALPVHVPFDTSWEGDEIPF